MSQFQFISPRSMCGSCCYGIPLISGFHKTTLFRALFFSPHLLSVQVLGLFSQALVAFPHLLVLFKFDSQIEEWERRTSSGTTTSGSNTSVFISLHSVTVRKGKGKRGLNSSQEHCHQSWNWMAPPDLQTCILHASQSFLILKINQKHKQKLWKKINI